MAHPNPLLGIYDSAIDRSRWSQSLEVAAQSVGASSAAIHMLDLADGAPYVLSEMGGALLNLGPERTKFYLNKFAESEKAAWALLEQLPVQTVILDEEVWGNMHKVRQREDFRFLEQHAGIFRRVAARLNENPGWFDGIVFQFSSGLSEVPVAAIPAAKLLLPHLAKSLELARTYHRLQTRYDAVIAAFDHVLVGVCVTSPTGEVVVKNQEAHRILDTDDGISLTASSNLQLKSSKSQDELARAIRRTSHISDSYPDVVETLLSVPRRTKLHPLLLEVCPLRDPLTELGNGFHGSIVFLIDVENTSKVHTERGAKLYQLTDAETAVCRLLLDGHTNAEIAEIRRVTKETVKTQLASISQKVGSSSRGELVRAFVRASPPVE